VLDRPYVLPELMDNPDDDNSNERVEEYSKA